MVDFWLEMAKPDASYSDTVRHRAALTVCHHATDRDDARELLQALGLIAVPANNTIRGKSRYGGWESYR